MNRRPGLHNKAALICLTACFCGVWLGATCANTGGGGPLDPGVPIGNRPPRAQIVSVVTPTNDNFAEQGELINIGYTGDDGENQCTLRLFASKSQTPTAAQEIPITSGIFLGPGPGSGNTVWNTTGVGIGVYFIFAEINDGVNPSVRVTAATSVQIAPPGSRPQNAPPQLVFLQPVSNLGLSSQDEVVIQYAYADPDNAVTLTLLLDKDQDPTNDNINNPGDPLDPNSKIIILPSTARKSTDPTFDGDAAPPTPNPAQPLGPVAPDSLEIRKNPRTLTQTAPGLAEFKEYRFTIDFSKIPVRNQPYYLRATIKDPTNTVHRYAAGSITITSLANGVVDLNDVGFRFAGARWGGFSTGEYLGTSFVSNFDLDGDANEDFVIGARYASPRNRNLAGAAYMIFGRRKSPFPLDTNGNGLPDVIGGNGTVDFPAPPPFVTNPYASSSVGRFGGVQNINSVNSFYRGVTYGMPEPHTTDLPPAEVQEANHPGVFTSGLTSMARLDMNADGLPDLIFGVPFISTAWEYHDDDPVDGGCDLAYQDGLPNGDFCDNTGGGPGRQNPNDDLSSARFQNEPINQGLVMAVNGANDIANNFRFFVDAAMAGQNDPAGPIDDEGINIGGNVPDGMRFRGSFLDPNFTNAIVNDNRFGETVAALPSIDNNGGGELAISIPGFQGGRGAVQIWLSTNFFGGWYADVVRSLPSYASAGCSQGMPTRCQRTFITLPVHITLRGAQPGDNFGYAGSAGQVNQDGTADVFFGAPGADRQAIVNGSPAGPTLTDNGVFYVLFAPAGGFGNTDLATENPPRIEIRGTHNGDQFGRVQASVADMNGDGIGDVALASENYRDDVRGNDQAGYVGVIFGNRPLTGENGFSPDQVGTPALSGVRFFGPTVGARAGRSVASAGDFNQDGFGDLLIAAPGETRNVNVGDTNGDGIDEIQSRKGVAYLVFGGTHLINKTFTLNQVGSPELPGIVFISRFVTGSQDEAPIDAVGGIGDTDGDGFDDIILGCPTADFVDPASPSQRRNNAGEVYIIYGNNFGSNRIP